MCRFIVAPTFIFSGFVKAVDPLGTQYKIQDYLEALGMGDALPDWVTLGTSVLLAALEFILGVLLLFAIHRRTVSKVIVVFLAIMTAITLWLALANPVSDCGCFGDAIHLTNWQTFGKNVVLLAMAVVIMLWPLKMLRFISKTNQWIVINYTALFILAISAWCLYTLPLFDFRPYHVGADIRAGMEIPEGEKPPQYETTFILEKDGEQKEFTLDEYPDSTWTFIDSKTVMTEEGYVPPIHDFILETVDEGVDITDSLLSAPGYTFLLVSPLLENAYDSYFGTIDQLYEYAKDHGYGFYGVTSSGDEAISRWRDLTGAEYPFCRADRTMLKTVIRSNPGLLLLKGGVVIRKWSHNQLPELDEKSLPLERHELGKLPEDSVPRKIATILLWFALPLFLLTLADRLWAWTRWLKRKKGAKKGQGARSKGQEAEDMEQEADIKEQGAGSKGQEAEDMEQEANIKEQGAGSKEQENS